MDKPALGNFWPLEGRKTPKQSSNKSKAVATIWQIGLMGAQQSLKLIIQALSTLMV